MAPGAQRAPDRHAGQAAHPGPAQRLYQNRLSLILGVVGGDKDIISVQPIANRAVACSAGAGFEPGNTHIDRNIKPLERDAIGSGTLGTERCPVRGGRFQAVTNVQRDHALRLKDLTTDMQQCGRITPAAEPDNDAPEALPPDRSRGGLEVAEGHPSLVAGFQ